MWIGFKSLIFVIKLFLFIELKCCVCVYILDFVFVDIDECVIEKFCKNNVKCDNIFGSYCCSCVCGYIGCNCYIG